MNTGQQNAKVMPKGGRKGGAVFPRVKLDVALGYARKLVTKTHTSRIPQDVLLSGVVGAKSGTGNVRISAIKQYGLLSGDQKTQFTASDLAKKIVHAPPDEAVALYQKCALRPNVFKGLSQTFHGDTVSKAKLKQRAAELNVHPDETENCVDVYVSSMLTAKLVAVDGDQVTHLVLENGAQAGAGESEAKVAEQVRDQDPAEGERGEVEESDPPNGASVRQGTGSKTVVTVNVTLDSTMDVEKLERQLALLKKYGAI